MSRKYPRRLLLSLIVTAALPLTFGSPLLLPWAAPLIVLVAMSFAGLAIMRSVGSGVLVASNLAFKQTTTAGAERGIEDAKVWLLNQSGTVLEKDIPANGYYSGWGAFDPTVTGA